MGLDNQKLLTRREATEYLRSRGLRVASGTLQGYAIAGTGPKYRMFGVRAMYCIDDLEAWIVASLRMPKKRPAALTC